MDHSPAVCGVTDIGDAPTELLLALLHEIGRNGDTCLSVSLEKRIIRLLMTKTALSDS